MVLSIRIVGSNAEKGFIEYSIAVDDGDYEWSVEKRYTDFLALDNILKDFPVRVHLPPKGLCGARHFLALPRFLARRQRGLEEYLTITLGQAATQGDSRYLPQVTALSDFLTPAMVTSGTRAPSSGFMSPSHQVVRIIRAANEEEWEVDTADTIGLLGYEVFMGNLSASHSGMFGVACLLGPLDEHGLTLLADSLQKVLTACPHFAGRVKGRSLALCNAGVPFNVVRKVGDICPSGIPHNEILEFCDMRAPSSIMAGADPLLTVKVNVFSDGAVLGVAASHCLLDGSSMFGFLKAWGCVCRGEAHGLREAASRAPLRHILKTIVTETEGNEDLIVRAGTKLEDALHQVDDKVPILLGKMHTAVCKAGASVALKAVVALVPRLLGGAHERVRLVIPTDKLQALKNAATPSPAAGGDGWVSTQEAVVAHLLLSLWRTFMANKVVKDGGCACVSFFVDVRRHLGLPDNFSFGTGFQVVDLHVKDMTSKTLSQCAAEIHEGSRSFGDMAKQKWCLWHRAFEDRVRLERFMRNTMASPSSDLNIAINNNSKRDSVHFGEAGGVASQFMSSMGPTLMLSSKEGLEIILGHDMYAASSEEEKQTFSRIFYTLP